MMYLNTMIANAKFNILKSFWIGLDPTYTISDLMKAAAYRINHLLIILSSVPQMYVHANSTFHRTDSTIYEVRDR